MQEILNTFEGRCELERNVRQSNHKTSVSWESADADNKWGYVSIHTFSNDERIDESLCTGISVNRPTLDPLFWKTMFELMEKFPLGMVFPTENIRWVLANESFRENFPTDEMPVEIVSTPEALCETITKDD